MPLIPFKFFLAKFTYLPGIYLPKFGKIFFCYTLRYFCAKVITLPLSTSCALNLFVPLLLSKISGNSVTGTVLGTVLYSCTCLSTVQQFYSKMHRHISVRKGGCMFLACSVHVKGGSPERHAKAYLNHKCLATCRDHL